MTDAGPETTALEERIGYRFKDPSLLRRSLTHPSFTQTEPGCANNQRLEFLGDAVLGLVLAEELFALLPDQREGVLTRYRSILVRGWQLSTLAREIGLGGFLRVGETVEATGGRDLDSVLEDAFEALIAAVYLDSGLDGARMVVRQVYGDLNGRLAQQLDSANPKGQLQELLQPRISSEEIEYRLTETEGPDHRKRFTVEVWIGGVCRGRGSGYTKQLAEKAAAREALASFG